MELTLLKLNVDGSTFTANAPFSGEDSDADATDETDVTVGEDVREGDEEGRGKAPFVAAVVGLLFLLGAAVVARRYLAEDGLDGADVEITEAVAGELGEE
ncbi:hypothetical protein N0B31_09025 [Salinirubellus salinus]|uniref:Uncharacterized protein n=1 Tax=Salinirubellus salinus TaxID=1364945 RepID=A0A9E7R5S2_9EURY|nr:hypothetical protein [Salinirubellus salinus]UWM56420.1 hypothetical protein N0B31_09025 [Salinirubellus salinus]